MWSLMLYRLLLCAESVYFGPDNFTGCVEFVLGVCNIVAALSLDAFRSLLITIVSHNTSTQLALVQYTHKSHSSLTMCTPLALFIILSPPRQLIMLAPADNAPSVERQLFNEEDKE